MASMANLKKARAFIANSIESDFTIIQLANLLEEVQSVERSRCFKLVLNTAVGEDSGRMRNAIAREIMRGTGE